MTQIFEQNPPADPIKLNWWQKTSATRKGFYIGIIISSPLYLRAFYFYFFEKISDYQKIYPVGWSVYPYIDNFYRMIFAIAIILICGLIGFIVKKLKRKA